MGTTTELSRGAAVGRYFVLERVGGSSYGAVYAAYDPELDRKVALKLLQGGARLLEEARGLAKLSHPNAVAVHDVGTVGDNVWLAMEFVEGETLRAWLDERRRTWREVLAKLEPAALGLAAAHTAGLVHGNIKPDNVMLGEDGRVRLIDFALAGANEADTLGSGKLSDQSSFCGMLWESLCGKRPVPGGRFVSGVPRALQQVVRRGLADQPRERWPSMEALLDALARWRRRSRFGRASAVVAAVVLAGAAVPLALQLDRQRRIEACATEAAAIDAVWGEDKRTRVVESFLATGASHAATTAKKLIPWLDDQAEAWRRARTDACTDATVTHAWTADLLDRSKWCLAERRMELDALVKELSRADVDAMNRSVVAAAGLHRLEPCRDATLLERLPAPPKDDLERVQAVQAQLARTRAAYATGAGERGLAAAREGLRLAEAVGWPPLEAAARVWVGILLDRTGAYDEAESTLELAYFQAAKAGAPADAFNAAVRLTFTVGYRQERHNDGLRWSRHAEMMRSRLPDPAALRQAANLGRRATVLHARGALDDSAELHERALTIWVDAFGPEHPNVATTLNNLAGVRASTGAFVEAAALHERAGRAMVTALGPEHPAVAASINNLANVQAAMGKYAEAERLYTRALGIWEKALGADHLHVAASLANLAAMRRRAGAYEESVQLDGRALAIREKALGPEHPLVAASLGSLGNAHDAKGEYEEAARLHTRALAIKEEVLGTEHRDVALTLNNLAGTHLSRGAFEEARTLFQRALRIAEGTLGAEHPDLTYSLIGLAEVAIARHRASDAIALAERTVAIREAATSPPGDLADAWFLLARALAAAGRSEERATALAKRALDAYRSAGPAKQETLGEVQAWLSSRGATE